MNQKFLKLGTAEKINRLKKLADSIGIVRLWSKKSNSRFDQICPVFEFVNNKLTLRALQALPKELKTPVFGNFKLAAREYFFRCDKLHLDQEDIILEIEDEFFQYEKRDEERLLCYPHRKVYLEVMYDYDKEHKKFAAANVLHMRPTFPMSKMESRPTSYMQTIENETTLRLIDLSLNGLSCLVNSNEIEHLSKLFQTKSFAIKLYGSDLKAEVFTKKIAYSTEFFDHSLEGVRLYKMGIEFTDTSPIIEDYLSVLLSEKFELFTLDDAN